MTSASRPWPVRVAASGCVLLAVLSVALALLPSTAGSHGVLLALVKVAALAFLFKRLLDGDVYTMQWSSMFILLFLAEGTVRAMSDRAPGDSLGLAEAIVAGVYFAAVLGHLRPLKKAATEQTRRRRVR